VHALLLFITATAFVAETAIAAPAGVDSESTRYWKPYVITPEQDQRVAKVQAIFQRLLRAWDSTRVEPVLYVVKSGDGPWAASLDDGSVLLSSEALVAKPMLDGETGDDRLAFVLAHELAHQRAGHLWHRQFFRLAGAQPPEARRKMLAGLQSGTQDWAALEDKEAQADHDGLVLMSVVGFNPFSIVDKEDFFSAWVENIWGVSCEDAAAGSEERKACNQAETRAIRTRIQLRDLAVQTTLFELGVQAYVAGEYPQARRYFIAFGRAYSGRVVHTNIGLTNLAEAQERIQQLADYGEDTGPPFVYPLILGSSPLSSADRMIAKGGSSTRGLQGGPQLSDAQRAQLHNTIDHLLDEAVHSFEQAVRIDPDDRQSYIHLACAYLIADNAPMARGILEGKYRPRFGNDKESDLLLAMTTAKEGHSERAVSRLSEMQHRYAASAAQENDDELLLYTLYHNLATLLQRQGDDKRAQSLWRDLAQTSKHNSDPTLFRLAVAQLQHRAPETTGSSAVRVHGHVLGDVVADTASAVSLANGSEVWIEGERNLLYRFADGASLLVNAKRQVAAAWQQGGEAPPKTDLNIGETADRIFHRYGIPSRRIVTERGEYYAYDGIGLAVLVEGQHIKGWFIYDRSST